MTLISLRISMACVFAIISGCAAAPPAPTKAPATLQINMNFNVQDQAKSQKNVERGAISGTPQHVGFYYSVNPDCTSNGLVKTQLKTPPTHGTVEFVNADGFTNFPASSSSYECNKKRSPGVEVKYTSVTDFVGEDQFIVQGIGPNGKYLETAYKVRVLAPN